MVRLDQLGDQILTLPFLDELGRSGNYARVEVLTTGLGAKVLGRHPVVDQVHVWDCPWFRGQGKDLRAWFWLKNFLTQWGEGCLVDLRGDVRVLSAAARAGIPEMVSFGGTGGGFLLTHEVALPKNVHAVDEPLALLEPLLSGGKSPQVQSRKPSPRGKPGEGESLEAGGQESSIALPRIPRYPKPWGKAPVEGLPERYLALHPDAGTPAKRWPLESWLELIQALLREFPQDLSLVLVGANPELDAFFGARSLSRRVQSTLGKTSLEQLETVLVGSKGLITMDSGPGHMAAALDKPVWVLWSGVADSARWRPLGEKVTVLSHPTECAPCIRTTCNVEGHPCLRELSPQKVLAAIQAKTHWIYPDPV